MGNGDEILGLLHPKVRELIRLRGWNDLTLPQIKGIPSILKGYNTLIIAPTGYGKTEAAIIPVLSMMLNENVEPIAVLYITPLRALINDLMIRIQWWANKLSFIVARKHGDVPQSERARRLRKVPHILIITPESLEIDLDWASRFREYYVNVRWVIVDEVHELVGTKRGVQLAVLLERLREITGKDFQVIGLSATIGSPEEAANLIFGSSKRPREIVEVKEAKDFEVRIDYVEYGSNDELWSNAVKVILKHVDPPSLVFVNSRFTAERLHEAIEKMGVKGVAVHHSSVSREVRQETEELLRKGIVNTVVCTKTLELGIDLGSVKSVIQFRPPGSVTSLIQRIGRSGHRIGDKSIGAVICLDDVDVLEAIATARLLIRRKLEPTKTLTKPLDVAARELMGMCLQFGEVDLEYAYKILKASYPFRDLTVSEFNELIKYLSQMKVIERNGSKIKLGPVFYKIWRFDEGVRRWWMRSFAEFFSFIGERRAFTVKYDDKTVGDVDAVYVYKYLRVGDVFRLAGKTWRVVSIDENLMRIDVVEADVRESEVPLWRGEGVKRDNIIALESSRVLEEAWAKGYIDVPENIRIPSNVVSRLVSLVNVYKKLGIPIPTTRRIIVERMGDEVFFTVFLGERIANTIAHMLMYLVSSKHTLQVAIRSAFYGFSVRTSRIDVVELLKSLTELDVEKLVYEAVRRSPLYAAMLKELQLSFGKIGKVDEDNDALLSKEALRQTIQYYFDVEGAKKFVESLRRGEVEIVDLGSPKILSPLAGYLRRMPEIRPWIPDVSGVIVRNLDGMAFTIDELAEITGLPPKTIEHKLKELRKPGSIDRVFQFLDVELGEWRWALARDVKVIVSSEIFSESFTPSDLNEAFLLQIKPASGESYIPVYFTPKEVLEDVERFKKKIPVDEAYEVKVTPLSSSLLQSLSPKYYYVSKDLIPYIALNGAAFLQKLKGSV